MIYFCVVMDTTNIAPAQSAKGSTRPSVGSSPKSLPTVSWKAVAMPRAGDYEKVSSSPQVNTGTKRMAKASVRHTHDSPSRGESLQWAISVISTACDLPMCSLEWR